MSESDTSTNSPDAPDSSEVGSGTEKPARPVLSGRWIPGRRARWITAGAVVVLVGGSALGVAAVHGHHDHGDVRRAARGMGDEGPQGGIRADSRPGGGRAENGDKDRDRSRDRGRAVGTEGRGTEQKAAGKAAGESRSDGLAPAPLPAITAVQAADKAATAVADGRVESLSTVAQQGGGTGWQVLVLGPDGVRHRVTVDGASGRITGNTVDGGRPAR